jgi:hypothetical protein
MKKVDIKKAVLWGIVVLVIDMVVGNALYMNPLVSGAFAQYEGHPSTKPMEAFGGLGNWLALTMIFGIVLMVVFIIFYLTLYEALPGSGWQKGLFYGLMLGVVKAVPEAFNQWMLFEYPTILIGLQLLNTLVGLAIFGLALAAIFERAGVFRHVEAAPA